jgi:hypothetical protein
MPRVNNPIGTTGLLGAIATLIVALLSVFDVDVELDVVATVLAAVWALVSAVIFRQSPPE